MNQEAHENLEIPWSGSTRVTEHLLCDTQDASEAGMFFGSQVETKLSVRVSWYLPSVSRD